MEASITRDHVTPSGAGGATLPAWLVYENSGEIMLMIFSNRHKYWVINSDIDYNGDVMRGQ